MCVVSLTFFFFNDTATTEIYTLSLHDALPIYVFQNYREALFPWMSAFANIEYPLKLMRVPKAERRGRVQALVDHLGVRSEEHTSELQSRQYLVCRLLLEKKKDSILYDWI